VTARTRITLAYAALLSLPLIALAATTYFVFAAALNNGTDRFIGDALNAIAREANAERRTALSPEQAVHRTVDEVRFRDLHITVLDGAGHAITPPLSDTTNSRIVRHDVTIDNARFTLVGTYTLRENERVLSRVRELFLVAIPIIVLAGAVGGYVLARRSLTRSFEQQRRFIADASHELRTPTATLRTEADVVLSREHRTEEEYRSSIAIMADAAKRLTRIVDDLFLLARTDSGHLARRDEPLQLEEVVQDAVSSMRAVAQQRGVRVALTEAADAPFRGDPDLLGRLFLNLLDNAVRYSPDNGAVDVAIRRGVRTEITVTDSGPGIPSDSRERVFERFFRVDKARARAENATSSGAGLGLAIGRRIAEMHGGTLEIAESRPGRTVFRVTL
jgi:signal transduction histidine kinase